MEQKAELIHLVSDEMIQKAILLALPTIRKMAPAMSWGPLGAVIGVKATWMNEPILHIMEEIRDAPDNIEMFTKVVLGKLETVERHGVSSFGLHLYHPASLTEEDTIHRGGVIVGDFYIAVSGFSGWGDEHCSYLIGQMIQFLATAAFEEIKNARKSGDPHKIGSFIPQARVKVLTALA